MSVLTLPNRPVSEQIRALERGLPSRALVEIADLIGVPKARLIEGLKLVARTIRAREKSGARLSAAESERLYRVVRLRTLARAVFATDAAVAEWLSAPDGSLGGKTPLEMLATDLGSQKAENLVRAMIHGVPV
jgi:putative toxin-antitoxin system antitoxin component (TIGR02293 family)